MSAEITEPAATSEAPANVKIAVVLYLLAIVATLAVFVPLLTGGLPADRELRFAVAALTVFSIPKVLLLSLFTFMAWRRRNWARVMLALWSAMTLFAGLLLQDGPLTLGADGLMSMILLGLMVVAAALLFTPAANAWYQRPGPAIAAAENAR